MAPDIEKRTVSSAHVPDLDGDRLAVQEHRQYWGRRRQIAKGIVVWAQPGNDRHHCGAASAPRPGFAGSSAIEGTAVMRRRGRVRLFMTLSSRHAHWAKEDTRRIIRINAAQWRRL